jgi:virginiamycin B lyase
MAAGGHITEFPLPSGSRPLGITVGPDGALWFAESGTNKIGRITTGGQVQEFPTPFGGSQPARITAGPDGNLWFTETLGDRIGRITPSGTITEFFTGIRSLDPEDITTGPDGALWFTVFPDPEGLVPGWVGRITTDGQMRLIPSSTQGDDVVSPLGIATGSDGNLWITGPGNGTVGRMTTSGALTVFHLPAGVASSPAFITAGPGGALYFTEQGLGSALARSAGNRIGRITTAGTIAELRIPTAGSSPDAITTASNGTLWFTELAGYNIARIG